MDNMIIELSRDWIYKVLYYLKMIASSVPSALNTYVTPSLCCQDKSEWTAIATIWRFEVWEQDVQYVHENYAHMVTGNISCIL